MANMIVLGVTLRFLALNTSPAIATWESTFDDHRIFMRTAEWLMAFSSVVLFLTRLGVNLIGHDLHDILDADVASPSRFRSRRAGVGVPDGP